MAKETEVTIEGLSKENEGLKATISSQAEEIKAKDTEISGLKSKVEEHQKAFVERNALLESASVTIADLSKKVDEANNKVEGQGSVVVTHEKKKYKVLIPVFEFNGQKIKAEDLKGLPEVVAELVEIKFAGFQLLN